MTLNKYYRVHFFVQKTKKNDFAEKKSDEKFGECSFLYNKRPNNIACHMYS